MRPRRQRSASAVSWVPVWAHRLAHIHLYIILGSNHGELSCNFALITGDNVEFNLRADHGLHELVKAWLLDSTAATSVN